MSSRQRRYRGWSWKLDINAEDAEGGTEETEEMHENEISKRVIGCAMNVHTRLGPGLLESAYEACLAYELSKAGLRF